jgi:predicted transcriptional regulator
MLCGSMNIFTKRISENDLISEFANVINGVLGLKPRDLEFFRELLTVVMEDLISGIDINSDDYCILHQDHRHTISERMDIEKSSLLRYISSFKDKGIIIASKGNKLRLRKDVLPSAIKNKIQVTVILTVDPRLNSPFANQ